MDKKIRNILIVIFGAIFVLSIPLILLYSQGYRFDFADKKIIRTGGFAFRTQPKSCEIYLNDKLTDKTDFIFGEVFIKNLLPKKYNVKIKKLGFFTWEKNLEVKEKMVTEAKNVMLFPEKNNFSVFLSDIEDYFFSPDEKKLILKRIKDSDWSLTFFNLENKEENNLLEPSDLDKKNKVILSDIKWSSDSKKILLEAEIKKESRYFVIDALKENKNYIFSLDYLVKPKGLSFNKNNSRELFFLKTTSTGDNLYKTNYYETSSLELPIKDVLAYYPSNNSIFWLNNGGFLNKSDISGNNLSGNNLTILNEKPLPIQENENFEIKILPDQKIFINSKKGLYFLNQEDGSFEKILNQINDLSLSPDSKNIYFFDNHEVWLSDELLEKIFFLSRFSQKIKNNFWLNSNYLIFNVEEKIKISEIDNRDKINIVELGSFENPKIFWNKNDKTLYLLSKGTIYQLENIIP